MAANEGTVDRIVRIVVGATLIAVGVADLVPGVWKWVVIVVGMVPLGTGVVGRCVLYPVLGISTKKAAEDAAPAPVEAPATEEAPAAEEDQATGESDTGTEPPAEDEQSS